MLCHAITRHILFDKINYNIRGKDIVKLNISEHIYPMKLNVKTYFVLNFLVVYISFTFISKAGFFFVLFCGYLECFNEAFS